AYGGVVIFFVGFMGSLTVYLAKWGVSQAPWIQSAGREPNFLFVYAPTSFGWRDLLLEGTQVKPTEEQMREDEELARMNGADVVQSRTMRPPEVGTVGGVSRWSRVNPQAYNAYLKTLRGWNTIGAVMVAFWLGLAFLFVLGFGYAYCWSASTIIYLLLRRSVDSAEMDEVYLEEDDYEASYYTPPTPTGAPRPGSALPMVEAPKPAPAPPPT